MDHLPLPPGAEPLHVPYVAEDYDQGDFALYPQRQKLALMLETSNFEKPKPEAWQTFFQTWLYFGCLIEVFKVVGLDVDPKRFVKETESGLEVSSVALHVYIDEWKFRDGAYRSDETRQSIWNRICAVLYQTRASLNGPVEAFNKHLAMHAEAQLPYWPNIALSIGLLGRTLQEVGYKLKYAAPKDWRQHKWGSHQVLGDRLQRSGWCRAEIQRFLGSEPLDFVYYVGALTSPRANDDHTECQETICRGKAANVSEYRTKHAPGCDEKCKFWTMPESSVHIVADKGIPLARWSDNGLEVLPLDDTGTMTYVAISHVYVNYHYPAGFDDASCLASMTNISSCIGGPTGKAMQPRTPCRNASLRSCSERLTTFTRFHEEVPDLSSTCTGRGNCMRSAIPGGNLSGSGWTRSAFLSAMNTRASASKP
jgi:hypothetical protein